MDAFATAFIGRQARPQESDAYMVGKYILPAFANLSVDAITVEHVKDGLASMTERPASATRTMPVLYRRAVFRIDSFEACSAFMPVPACMAADPSEAVPSPECFSPFRDFHEPPGVPLIGRRLLGGIRTHQREVPSSSALKFNLSRSNPLQFEWPTIGQGHGRT